jgi:hypothetical protein
MPELRWRDNAEDRETLFPWSVPDCRLESFDPMVKVTAAGKCVLFIDTFEDCTLAICLTYPGGARFARVSPDTNWALEERVEASPPEPIAREMDEVWRETLGLFAARIKELRKDTPDAKG